MIEAISDGPRMVEGKSKQTFNYVKGPTRPEGDVQAALAYFRRGERGFRRPARPPEDRLEEITLLNKSGIAVRFHLHFLQSSEAILSHGH